VMLVLRGQRIGENFDVVERKNCVKEGLLK
jgi:hypothetical protein